MLSSFKYAYRDPRRTQSLKFVLLFVALHLVVIFPLQALLSTEWMRENVYDITESPMIDAVASFPPGWFFLFAFIVAPLWEETVFRLWMNLKSVTIPIFVTLVPTFMLWPVSEIVALVVGLILLIVTLTQIHAFRHNMDIHFRWWYYGSALLFGLIHISNHGFDLRALPFILPQILAGLAIGYMRVQRGFFAGVLVHATWNGLLAMTLLIPYFDSTSKTTSTKQATTEWKSGDMWAWGSSSYTGVSEISVLKDSVYIENRAVESVLQQLVIMQNPQAVVEIDGASLARIQFAGVGRVESMISQVLPQWIEEYGLEIDTFVRAEKTYYLQVIPDCEPESIPGETIAAMKILGRLSTTYGDLDLVARDMQSTYHMRFEGEATGDAVKREIILPVEGLDSALQALRVYNCLEYSHEESEVTRYVVRLPEM